MEKGVWMSIVSLLKDVWCSGNGKYMYIREISFLI